MSMKLSDEQQQLVLENRNLVHYIVLNMGITQKVQDYEDLVSIGTIGLIKAAISFDISKEIKFATYASRCIKNEILMYFRKINRYANDISLEEPIAEDFDGNDLTLSNVIEDPKANFLEEILDKEQVSRILSIIINLPTKESIIIFYRMGGLGQKKIADEFNLSQSYISRIETRAINRIRVALNRQKKFDEAFMFEVMEDKYRISFSSNDVKELLSAFLQKVSAENLPDFEVSRNNETVIIQLPADSQSFVFIAQIIQDISGSFNMHLASDKKLHTDNVSKKTKKSKESKKNNRTKEVGKKNIAVKVKTKNSKTSQIRDYMLGLEFFTVKQLKNHFPDCNNNIIRYTLGDAREKGIITKIGYGKYKVNKK